MHTTITKTKDRSQKVDSIDGNCLSEEKFANDKLNFANELVRRIVSPECVDCLHERNWVERAPIPSECAQLE